MNLTDEYTTRRQQALEDIAQHAALVRRVQKLYFATKQSAFLVQSKVADRMLDSAFARLASCDQETLEFPDRNHPVLFDASEVPCNR